MSHHRSPWTVLLSGPWSNTWSKMKNDHFGSVRWRKSLSRMRVTTAAGKVCLSDSLQSWWNNELLPDLWLWFFSPPCHKCNVTTGNTHLTPFRMRRLPMALLPGLQVQLLCTLISINTHCLLDHHQCGTFGPWYWGFPYSALVSPFILTVAHPFCSPARRTHFQGYVTKLRSARLLVPSSFIKP